MRSFEAVTRIDAALDAVHAGVPVPPAAHVREHRPHEGRVALGERVTIYATMIRNRPFQVTVTELRPNEAMRWRGGLPLGLAVIERTYSLDAQDDGSTVVTVREDHTGPLAGLLGRSTPDLNPSFRQFCAGLKARTERQGAQSSG